MSGGIGEVTHFPTTHITPRYVGVLDAGYIIDPKPGGIIIPNIYLAAMLSKRHQKYDIHTTRFEDKK